MEEQAAANLVAGLLATVFRHRFPGERGRS
jgi:hypothetical protein